MTKSDDNITAAVKKLRKRLLLTQTEFAATIDRSLSTAIRYETVYPPRGKDLRRMAAIARLNGLQELADTFRNALELEFTSNP